MKFSVLMSLYNKEKGEHLVNSLESIINQTVKPSEILIVKDGPLTLDLEKIIDDFIKEYPKLFTVIELKENKGLGVALNIGVNKAKYDIIARMDSDDICASDRFEKQIGIFKKNLDIDIVGSYISEFEKSIEKIVSVRKVPLNNNEIKKMISKKNPFNHMTVMYRKDAVIKAGNYEAFLWNEDYYLWGKMFVNGAKMKNIPESLVYARIGREMFKRRGGIKYALQDIKLQIKFKEMKITNYCELIFNIGTRCFVRLIPNALRSKIYMIILRR